MPPHCQLRATKGTLADLEKMVDLNLAAFSTYCAEANKTMMLTVVKDVRNMMKTRTATISGNIEVAIGECQSPPPEEQQTKGGGPEAGNTEPR